MAAGGHERTVGEEIGMMGMDPPAFLDLCARMGMPDYLLDHVRMRVESDWSFDDIASEMREIAEINLRLICIEVEDPADPL